MTRSGPLQPAQVRLKADTTYVMKRSPRQVEHDMNGLVALAHRAFPLFVRLVAPHGHRELPRPREHLWILDRRDVVDPIRVRERPALAHRMASLWKLPTMSNHVLSLWLVTSTTSVLPSHRPRESPIHNLSVSPTGGRPSR